MAFSFSSSLPVTTLLLLLALATSVSASFYDLNVFNIDGQPVSLRPLFGTVSLVVNVASFCGLTKGNYEEMQAVQRQLGGKGFQVLAFPCNQFNQQEPLSNAAVKAFAIGNYSATFPMFAKVTVNNAMCRDGAREGLLFCTAASSECCAANNKVYQYLKAAFPGDIEWNFAKFLVSKEGTPLKRYAPTVPPLSIVADIKTALAKPLSFTQ